MNRLVRREALDKLAKPVSRQVVEGEDKAPE